ncbi:IS66 family insertion sequence element accessory protein TnpB [Novosphingobium sp. MMS21-SN21R]|uniref:IS66 family insertion sequence element accessory protein TnpB n=1 Tax=Novosphingobium sp. MMS21-SN21R TaxID=2969298 RepID=UPI00288709AF|nr:IS66 family insertion sequence element accessory protein TnpB [Novosphingobium sp. MMS21-SN21R]MDT0507011.1 IS66 family insertion sequence element accessory protein TnpB [Novosphingobium sp. MMS21-SN21R]
MIGLGAGARVMVATRPVDFRKGPDALAALVGAEYGGDPFSGVIYVFRAKRADRIKLVWWDGTGLCLMAKKLEQGGFKWPSIQDGVMRLGDANSHLPNRDRRIATSPLSSTQMPTGHVF